jgi:phosphohistidine swiveling domain-containing protein
MSKKINLELMWEGVESFYFCHLGVLTQFNQLGGWHQEVEKTMIIDVEKRMARCYYDSEEMTKVSKLSLANFLDKEWVDKFIRHSEELLQEAQEFVLENHSKVEGLKESDLVMHIKRAHSLMADTLLAFHVTQPQYTWEIESHIFSKLPNLSKGEVFDVISSLSQSSVRTLLSEEEDVWAALLQNIKSYSESLPESDDVHTRNLLKIHSQKYGLVRAADAQSPWSLEDLYERLTDDWEGVNLKKDRQLEVEHIAKQKQEVVLKYNVSEEVVEICHTLARLSHIRLETRLRGWMPIEYIFANELIPAYSRFSSYSAKQLESCLPDELFTILDGSSLPDKEMLENRYQHCTTGVMNGELVLWTNDDISRNLLPLIPILDLNTEKISGQTAMKGKVTGVCHIVNWEDENIITNVDKLPDKLVIVAGQTRPQLMPLIKSAIAIITDEGGLLSHAAIVSRELKTPCIIGTKHATKILKNGDLVEVDADNGIVKILERAKNPL